MARIINRLNARAVDTLTRPGRHADGGGLYLSISPNGGRRWTFLYRWHGKPTEIGFGSARDVPLADARELAAQARKKLAAGENPKQVRRSTTEASFGACAERLIAAMRPSWRNAEHARQWETTLRRDAAALSHLPVDKISTEEVLGVLQPLWLTKPVTASRLRGRIERVLDAAKAKGLRPQGVEIRPAGAGISINCCRGARVCSAPIMPPWAMSTCRASCLTCKGARVWRRGRLSSPS